MSTSAPLGDLVSHADQVWYVVRVVESSTFFEDSDGPYLLEEKYAELRHVTTSEIAFKYFSQVKHPFVKPNPDVKGLNPKVWRKF